MAMLYRSLLVVFLTLLLRSFVSGCWPLRPPQPPLQQQQQPAPQQPQQPTPQQTQQPTEIQLKKSGLFYPEEEVGSIESYGIFLWPKTSVEKRATLACPYNKEPNATRECYFLSEAASGGSAWQPVNATECKFQHTRSKDIFLLAEAYRKWREANGKEDKLPGQDFNNDQLFFIGFAQAWCAKYREEAITSLLESDTHSLKPARVRVPVSNFPEFSKAFGCKEPAETCSVW